VSGAHKNVLAFMDNAECKGTVNFLEVMNTQRKSLSGVGLAFLTIAGEIVLGVVQAVTGERAHLEWVDEAVLGDASPVNLLGRHGPSKLLPEVIILPCCDFAGGKDAGVISPSLGVSFANARNLEELVASCVVLVLRREHALPLMGINGEKLLSFFKEQTINLR